MFARVFHDLRHSARRLRKAPGFSIASIGMLAFGIGLSVAMFCTLSGVLLRGLPFPDSGRLVMLEADSATQHIEHAHLTVAEAEQLAAGTQGFDALAYFTYWTETAEPDGQRPRDITAQKVSADFFEVLGLKPLLGRALSPDDIRLNRATVVLSYGEWQRSFGGDPNVIGRRMRLANEPPLEIVGVMPSTMNVFTGDTGLWRPLATKDLPQDPHQRFLLMIGRLHSGVSLQQAATGLEANVAALRDANGSDPSDWRMQARPFLDILVGDVRLALWGAFALAVLVLLIAAANVAILLDGRQTARRHEQAVMQAIGATRMRVWRGLLLELALIAGLASVLGIALAHIGVRVLRELARDSIPRIDGIAMDWSVVAFAVLLGVIIPLFAILTGSLRLRAQPNDAIRSGGKGLFGDNRQRRVLPAVATALSTMSLIAALTFAATLWKLQSVDPGFSADQVHALQIFSNAPSSSWAVFADRIRERLSALSGTRSVALTSSAPLSNIGPNSIDMIVIGRAANEPMQVAFRRVSPGYRALLGIPLLAGRDFADSDRGGTESVAIINRTAARRAFGETSPLGQQITLPMRAGEIASFRIVGVVEDIRNAGLRMPASPEILIPFAQHPSVAMTFLLRGDRPMAGIDAQMAEAVWEIDPQQAITRQYALVDELADQLRPARFFAGTVGAFALAALLLAMLGVYAVASLQQQRRIGEFGLRLAIGASPTTLARAILRESLSASAVGVLAGSVAAWLVFRLAQTTLLVDGSTRQLPLLAAGMLAMVMAAVLAALLPAWRASRIDPMVALRSE
ncbi:MAG: ADOP family duplicated permease [Dokdonella sp.]|uniref:ADOP family duplicated permease n=1 Tax=Dokdonella sp. TaxID=2291710 RepID=UPI00326600CF